MALFIRENAVRAFNPGPGRFVAASHLTSLVVGMASPPAPAGSGSASTAPQVTVIEPVSRAGGKLWRFGGPDSNGLYPTKSEASLVHQQEITNCPVLAILSALVHTCRKQINELIREVPGTPISNIFEVGPPKTKPKKLYAVSFSDGDVIHVSDLVYFQYDRPVYGYSDDHTAWVPLIEKAYVLRKATDFVYENLSGQVTLEYAMVDMLGPCLKVDVTPTGATSYKIQFDEDGILVESGKRKKLSDDQLLAVLRDASSMATIAGHGKEWHTYTVLKVENKMITLREAMRDKTKAVGISDFKKQYDSVVQALHHRACGR